jgi:hypothetical protein
MANQLLVGADCQQSTRLSRNVKLADRYSVAVGKLVLSARFCAKYAHYTLIIMLLIELKRRLTEKAFYAFGGQFSTR